MDATSLPPEYVALDRRLRNLRQMYEGLIRVHDQMTASEKYEPPIQEQMIGVMDKINETFGGRGPSPAPASPLTQHHACAKVCVL